MKALMLALLGSSLVIESQLYAQWPEPIRIMNDPVDHSEPAVAYSPAGPNILMCGWNDLRVSPLQPRAGFAFSTNGGTHWLSNALIPSHDPFYPYAFDPSVAFDLSATAFYCHATGRSGPIGGPIVVSRTTDQGITWTSARVSPNGIEEQDKPFMAIDNFVGSPHFGHIYVSWTDFSSGNAIRFAYSTNGGVDWSIADTIDETGSFFEDMNLVSTSPMADRNGKIETALVHGSMPAVTPNGDVYVTWLRHDVPGQILIRRSTNGGMSFLPTCTVSGPIETRFDGPFIGGNGCLRASSMPSIATDPISGFIYVAYTEWGKDYDVKCMRSTDHGTSWVPVQNPTDRTEDHQFFPCLAVSPSGTLNLLYYDLVRSNPPSLEVRVGQSFNQGVSFITPSSVLSSFDPDSFDDPMGRSDYISVAASLSSDVYATYTGLGPALRGAVYGTFDSRPAQPQNFYWYGQPGQHPTLTWTANQEADLAGYNIYRFDPTIGSNGLWVKLNISLITTNSYTDSSITLAGGGIPSHYEHYRVHAVDQQQLESVPSEQVEVLATGLPLEKQPTGANSVPPTFAMHHNYPNPFNPSTQIRYDLPDAGFVSLVVYDVLGRKVADLVNGIREAGYYSAIWNAANAASGVYIARLVVSNEFGKTRFTKTTKLVLMK
jgi:hypothetical protein